MAGWLGGWVDGWMMDRQMHRRMDVGMDRYLRPDDLEAYTTCWSTPTSRPQNSPRFIEEKTDSWSEMRRFKN